jgi:hypothetical protein
MPIMDIISFFTLEKDNVRVTIVEFSQEFGILSDRFKLFDSVNLDLLFTSLLKESLGLCLELLNLGVKFFSF